MGVIMKMRNDLMMLIGFYLLICTLLIWGVVAAAWDLIMGFAGIFTFGQVAFYVIGAYGSAILTRTFGISPWLGIPAGGLITGIIGVLVGLPCLRLKGSYVALVTFAVHMILEPFLKSNPGRAIGTGGPQGILSIPPLKLFGYTYDTMELVPWYFTVVFFSFISLYLVFYGCFLLVYFSLYHIQNHSFQLGTGFYRGSGFGSVCK
jgi:branched-chain amino acid transport system permease protein